MLSFEIYLCFGGTCNLHLYYGRVSCNRRINVRHRDRWTLCGSASKLMEGSAARKGQGQNNPVSCLTSHCSHLLCLFWTCLFVVPPPPIGSSVEVCRFILSLYIDLSSIADFSTQKLEAMCFCERSVIQDITSQNTVFINC